MKIAIDINELANISPSGVKTYTREIVNALLEVDQDNEYFLYAREKVKIRLSKNCHLKILKWPLLFWTYTCFAREIKKQRPDILFMPIQSAPFLFFKPKKIKIVITVHDLAFLKFPKHFTFRNRLLLSWHTRRAVKMADKIIVPSQATENDLINLYGVDSDKVKVIYHGYGKIYPMASKRRKSSVLAISNPYILFVGTIQPRKNIINLVKAFETLKKGFKFQSPTKTKDKVSNFKLIIIGGKGWLWRKTLERIKKSPARKDIILTDAVSDRELAELYSQARIFILPSLYEGFGLPILEAFSYGAPVIASNNSSLAEITGEAGLLVDPNNPEEIAKAIEKIIKDDGLRNDLIKKGKERIKNFNWEKSARKHLRVFEEC